MYRTGLTPVFFYADLLLLGLDFFEEMKRTTFSSLLFAVFIFFHFHAWSQEVDNKAELKIGAYTDGLKFDGLLNDPCWQNVDSIANLTMVEPEQGATPSFPTVIKVLMSDKEIILGIICYDDDPGKIVSFSKAKDSELRGEDYIKFVFDTYRDGRTGYIFAINPNGARYDALSERHGEDEDANWDGIWDAKTFRGDHFWSAEIRIPIRSLTFGKSLTNWGFNFERRIQRLQEVDRWAGARMDYRLAQVIVAGLLRGLPDFNLGLGTTIKPSLVGDISGEADQNTEYSWKPSLDVIQYITPEITAQLTVNTDFAETEVDTRRTNLTRFSLFFPEKRQFFLEGSDIYAFGLASSRYLLPFNSRRVGLYHGDEVPLVVGGKVNGKVNKTNFGALITHMGKLDTTLSPTNLAVVRVKQNILKESTVGMISTFGDPEGRSGSAMAGIDFTYRTSYFKGDKNLLFGVWGLYNWREDLGSDRSAFGFKLDYPNDRWDIFVSFQQIGKDFDPSLGFVPRPGIKMYSSSVDFMPRPKNIKFIRQFFFESFYSLITDTDNHWESYRVFTAPVHFLLESGDRFEFNIMPAGEYLKEPFEIAPDVIIPAGGYNWIRSRLELETASKRAINGQITWWYGGFYDGWLDQIELQLFLRPLAWMIIELNYEKNIAKLPFGNFDQSLFGGRLQLNFTPDIQLSSFIQYDNLSNSIGANTRMRWTFVPRGDLFIVYNHNMARNIEDRFSYQSNQLIAKLTYSFWL